MVFLGFVTGPLFDMGYFKHLLAAGTALIVGGTLAQSACTTLWQLLLAQGVCIGVGTGCLAILSVGVPSMWFDTRLPLANGLAACGSGVGGVVYPVVFRRLNAAVGFGWAVRVVALIALLTLGFANATMRLPPAVQAQLDASKRAAELQRQQRQDEEAVFGSGNAGSEASKAKRQHRALYDPTAIRDVPYCLFVVGCFTMFLGMYVPYFYLPSYATDLLEATTGGSLTGDDLLSILNGVSIAGRILLGYLAISIGPQNLIVVVSGCSSIAALCLMAVESSLAGLIVVTAFYGFLTGAFFALQPSVFSGLSAKRPEVIGTRFGMAFTVMSFGMLFGSPIAGALKQVEGYSLAWTWAGAAMIAGAILIFGSLLAREGSIYSAR